MNGKNRQLGRDKESSECQRGEKQKRGGKRESRGGCEGAEKYRLGEKCRTITGKGRDEWSTKFERSRKNTTAAEREGKEKSFGENREGTSEWGAEGKSF